MSDSQTPSQPDMNFSDLSFEDALRELESIVSRLESGNVNLSSSIDLYERGEKLRMHCENQLKAAQARVEKLILNKDGSPSHLENAAIEGQN